MNLHPQIQKEHERIKSILSTVKDPDPMDAAVVHALASDEVNKVLGEILDDGAYLTGITMEAAGSMEGLVLFIFNTEWTPGQSRVSFPDVACALLEVNPPKIIKVLRQRPGSMPEAAAFTQPEGPMPAILQNMQFPSSKEALEFNRQANETFEQWLAAQQMGNAGGGQGRRRRVGFTTGTRCTSLLCFERTSDDWDWA